MEASKAVKLQDYQKTLYVYSSSSLYISEGDACENTNMCHGPMKVFPLQQGDIISAEGGLLNIEDTSHTTSAAAQPARPKEKEHRRAVGTHYQPTQALGPLQATP